MLLPLDTQRMLVKIARTAIDNTLMARALHQETSNDPALQQCVGCFVTLKIDGHLRGCLGNFTSKDPLYLEVEGMAVAAATSDPRFPPMTQADIGSYSLDISVLSPLVRINAVDRIQVGTHGIYLIKGSKRGVLLPQVATELGWDRQTFLEQTCLKAGLSTTDWRSPQTEIYIFSAQIITETEGEGPLA